MLTILYVRHRPSFTRILMFICYNFGIYIILLTPLCEELNHSSSSSSSINDSSGGNGGIGGVDGVRDKKHSGRNWNIKKTQ